MCVYMNMCIYEYVYENVVNIYDFIYLYIIAYVYICVLVNLCNQSKFEKIAGNTEETSLFMKKQPVSSAFCIACFIYIL